nr:DNA glycosylase [Halopelagius inordinatus]
MNSGTIRVSDVASNIDLQSTLESAQSFLWRRTDGRMYEEATPHGSDWWYYTVTGDDAVFVRQQSGQLEWRATTDAVDTLHERLRLNDDLDDIFATFPDDSPLYAARRAFPGLRVVSDPFFPCLVSFICSARTTVDRIHDLTTHLARELGDTVTDEGSTYHAFPRPEQLETASETDLRQLGLGFRAPYVVERREWFRPAS